MAFSPGGGAGRAVRPEMNVTPLCDVVLVLLIIFMVITPLLVKQFSLHVPRPAPSAAATPPADGPPPVVVSVRAAGRGVQVRINREVVRLAELEPRLRRVLAARSDRLVFFGAADGVPFGDAMQVLDRARGGGAFTIAVLTEELPVD